MDNKETNHLDDVFKIIKNRFPNPVDQVKFAKEILEKAEKDRRDKIEELNKERDSLLMDHDPERITTIPGIDLQTQYKINGAHA